MQHFSISRNGQIYGPYSLDELKGYVTSGHVLLTDLARSNDNTAWVPIAEFLPGVPQPITPVATPSGYTPPLYSSVALDSPPNLHWALVLLFDLLTCSLFQMAWNLVISAWFRGVAPNSRALMLYIAATILIIMQFVVGQIVGFSQGMHGFGRYGLYSSRAIFFHGRSFALYGLLALACWIVRLIARFAFRAELERHYNVVEPLSLSVNPVLTFFFGGIYLQSVMNQINERRRLLTYASTGYAPGPYGPG